MSTNLNGISLVSPHFPVYQQKVTNYDYIIVRTKSQLGWLKFNLPHLPMLRGYAASDCRNNEYIRQCHS